MVIDPVNRIMRRLTAAEGFLELQLPGEALGELELIENPGPFEGPYMWMLGEALRYQGRYEEAIAPLSHAAGLLPMPVAQDVWAALAECLTKSGRKAPWVETTQALEQLMLGNLDVEHLEERNVTGIDSDDRIDSPPTVRIEIPPFAKVQVDIDEQNGLTISINLPTGGMDR